MKNTRQSTREDFLLLLLVARGFVWRAGEGRGSRGGKGGDAVKGSDTQYLKGPSLQARFALTNSNSPFYFY